MNKKVAIVQSNYIPWKGYFDLINSVDEFILLDTVQYTRRDWRNRNKIKIVGGTTWLTIPVNVKGRFTQRICDTTIQDAGWASVHWRSICQGYARAPYFDEYRSSFEDLYLGCREENLSRVNHKFLQAICEILSIETTLTRLFEADSAPDATDRLLQLCTQAGAHEYVSGPAARGYLDDRRFLDAGISVSWMNYDGYRPYAQLHAPYVDRVSVLDLIFCEGPRATEFMKSFDG